MDDGGWMSFFPCKKFTCLPVVLGLLLSVSKSKAVVVMEYGLMNWTRDFIRNGISLVPYKTTQLPVLDILYVNGI